MRLEPGRRPGHEARARDGGLGMRLEPGRRPGHEARAGAEAWA